MIAERAESRSNCRTNSKSSSQRENISERGFRRIMYANEIGELTFVVPGYSFCAIFLREVEFMCG